MSALASSASSALTTQTPGGQLMTEPVLAPALNLPTKELRKRLAATRAGDPLGIGLQKRPPPPPDPDVFDPAAESARALFPPEEQAGIAETIKSEGYWDIKKVREILLGNTPKGGLETNEEITLDPEDIMLIDAHVAIKVFVADDNVYSREELYNAFAFQEMGTQPEAIFEQQEIAVFPPKQTALTEALEYMARDVGDETVAFLTLEDMVAAACDKPERGRKLLKVVQTKVWCGRERWQDFKVAQRLFRTMNRVHSSRNISGTASPFAMVEGRGMSSGAASPLAIQSTDQVAEERDRMAERMRQMEEMHARHALEAKKREEEMKRRQEEIERKIKADMSRIEERVAESMRTATARMEAAKARAKEMSEKQPKMPAMPKMPDMPAIPDMPSMPPMPGMPSMSPSSSGGLTGSSDDRRHMINMPGMPAPRGTHRRGAPLAADGIPVVEAPPADSDDAVSIM